MVKFKQFVKLPKEVRISSANVVNEYVEKINRLKGLKNYPMEISNKKRSRLPGKH